MTDENPNPTNTKTAPRRRPGPLFWVGTTLWVVCLILLCIGWSEWRVKSIAESARLQTTETAANDSSGSATKQIKLIPQKDGSFVAKEVTGNADEDSPWEKEGIEDFQFTDTDNRSISKKDLVGKPFIISFIFTHCRGPCPNVTLEMKELQNRLKDYDFNLVTLTVDPERDTLDILKDYGKSNGADFNRWKFLSGNQSDIYGLIQRSFKMPVEETIGEDRKPGFEIIHSTNIMLVDATGRVTGKYNALKEEDKARLRRDIKAMAKRKTNDDPAKKDGDQ